MRSILTFMCENSACAATLDAASGTTGLLIVSGGNEVRAGTHRGMAKLAVQIAGQGFPVFRFDRRGVGDSAGENTGYENSADDIAAALVTFRSAQPQLDRVMALGNCDAATALLLHHNTDLSALVLGNPWVVDVDENAPSPASTRVYYANRLRDPKAWLRVLRGLVNLRDTAGSLTSVVAPHARSPLALAVAQAMVARPLPTTILLAAHDRTAIGFADQWANDIFDPIRGHTQLKSVPSASHSFASSSDHATLLETVLAALVSA